MRNSTIERLAAITPEEQRILDGQAQVEKEIYTTVSQRFQIDSRKMIRDEQYLAVRPHTRFIDFPLHSHDFIELMYVCRGRITHVIEGKEIELHKGDLIFLNQYVRHEIKKAQEEDLGINFLVLPQFFDIPLSLLGKQNLLADFIVNILSRNTVEPEYLVFHTENNAYIENLMENVIVAFLEEESFLQMQQMTLGMVFLHLLHHMEYLGKESSKNYEEMMASTVLCYIEENYRNANLQELAERLHSSVSGLSKQIKRTIGVNFKELLQQKRLQKAGELLWQTELTVSDVMNAVGYENSSYFYNQFRETYGMSPREYRLSHDE